MSQERVASELRRLHELRVDTPPAEMRIGGASNSNQNLEGGAVASGAEESINPMSTQGRQGAVAPDSERNREDNEAYAPQRSERFRGRLQSPDPYMFSSTIWIRHDSEAKCPRTWESYG